MAPKEECVLDRVDDLIARIERALLLLSLSMMTLLIGADVTQRTFSRPIGRTEAVLLWLGERTTGPLSADAQATLTGPVGAFVFLALAALFFVAGARTAQGGQGTWATATAKGLGALAAVAAGVKLLLVLFPSSVPGAQKFALGFMLWSGMLGASLATKARRHIVLDPVVKKLTGDDRKRIAFAGGLVAAAACAFIAVLGAMQLGGEFHEWKVGDGVGVYPALPVPLWLATLAIPTTFATMAFRFAKNAAHDLRHGPPSTADAHSVDLEALKEQAVDAGEVATPAPTGGAA
jgi:TRAP-type C4-dicarboxylate transport system permease small subunit